MIIKLSDIEKIFYLMTEKAISREEAQEKAIRIRETYDKGGLEFLPREYENEIWDALQFIELFAEKESEYVYLYTVNDLINYINEKGWSKC